METNSVISKAAFPSLKSLLAEVFVKSLGLSYLLHLTQHFTGKFFSHSSVCQVSRD